MICIGKAASRYMEDTPLIRSPQIVHNRDALLCVLVLVKKDYREPNGLTCLVLTCHSLM